MQKPIALLQIIRHETSLIHPLVKNKNPILAIRLQVGYNEINRNTASLVWLNCIPCLFKITSHEEAIEDWTAPGSRDLGLVRGPIWFQDGGVKNIYTQFVATIVDFYIFLGRCET